MAGPGRIPPSSRDRFSLEEEVSEEAGAAHEYDAVAGFASDVEDSGPYVPDRFSFDNEPGFEKTARRTRAPRRRSRPPDHSKAATSPFSNVFLRTRLGNPSVKGAASEAAATAAWLSPLHTLAAVRVPVLSERERLLVSRAGLLLNIAGNFSPSARPEYHESWMVPLAQALKAKNFSDATVVIYNPSFNPVATDFHGAKEVFPMPAPYHWAAVFLKAGFDPHNTLLYRYHATRSLAEEQGNLDLALTRSHANPLADYGFTDARNIRPLQLFRNVFSAPFYPPNHSHLSLVDNLNLEAAIPAVIQGPDRDLLIRLSERHAAFNMAKGGFYVGKLLSDPHDLDFVYRPELGPYVYEYLGSKPLPTHVQRMNRQWVVLPAVSQASQRPNGGGENQGMAVRAEGSLASPSSGGGKGPRAFLAVVEGGAAHDLFDPTGTGVFDPRWRRLAGPRAAIDSRRSGSSGASGSGSARRVGGSSGAAGGGGDDFDRRLDALKKRIREYLSGRENIGVTSLHTLIHLDLSKFGWRFNGNDFRTQVLFPLMLEFVDKNAAGEPVRDSQGRPQSQVFNTATLTLLKDWLDEGSPAKGSPILQRPLALLPGLKTSPQLIHYWETSASEQEGPLPNAEGSWVHGLKTGDLVEYSLAASKGKSLMKVRVGIFQRDISNEGAWEVHFHPPEGGSALMKRGTQHPTSVRRIESGDALSGGWSLHHVESGWHLRRSGRRSGGFESRIGLGSRTNSRAVRRTYFRGPTRYGRW